MEKIQMKTPLVEMDGDEMTRVIWKTIKDELILPFVDLKTEYYDLGLLSRNATDDQITVDAAKALVGKYLGSGGDPEKMSVECKDGSCTISDGSITCTDGSCTP